MSAVTLAPGAEALPAAAAGANRIVDFLHGKTLLITGATGFLAKVLVEKILREQPNIAHIYLLIQPRADMSPAERLAALLTQPVFDAARAKYGAEGFAALMRTKLSAVAGDMSAPRMGLQTELYAQLQRDVDVIVNSAATTAFDERYDSAVRLNTLGALEFAEFGAGCAHLHALVHVSTAFVNGCRQGHTPEAPFVFNRSIAQV